MKHTASDLCKQQLMILAGKAEAHNEDTIARQPRPDRRTVTGVANGTRFELHCYFRQRKAVLRSQSTGTNLHPEDVFPERYCGVWDHEYEIGPLQ